MDGPTDTAITAIESSSEYNGCNFRMNRNENDKELITWHLRMGLVDVQALDRRRYAWQALLMNHLGAFVHPQSWLVLERERDFGSDELIVVVVSQVTDTHARGDGFQAGRAIGKGI